MQFITFVRKPAAILALCAVAWSPFASTAADSLPTELQSRTSSAMPSVVPVIAGFGAPLRSQKLADLRGGFETVNNDMQLSGSVANNSTANVTSGNNYITGGSFANMNGLPVTIQNSGSNVLIQNATIVNVQFQ